MGEGRARPRVTAAECSVVRALAVIGERWTMLLLRQAFYGVRRFDEMQEDLGISRKVLAERLARMVRHGLLARVPYQDEGQRTRQEYRLTARGEALAVVLAALMQWGDQHLPKLPRGRPVRLVDRETRQEVRAALVREDGAEVPRRALLTEFWPEEGGDAARREGGPGDGGGAGDRRGDRDRVRG